MKKAQHKEQHWMEEGMPRTRSIRPARALQRKGEKNEPFPCLHFLAETALKTIQKHANFTSYNTMRFALGSESWGGGWTWSPMSHVHGCCSGLSEAALALYFLFGPTAAIKKVACIIWGACASQPHRPGFEGFQPAEIL